MESADRKSPRLVSLSWHQPVPAAAAAWLAESVGWTGAGPLDLSNCLVMVPTRQSGRRLREALAEHAAAQGQAVFPPRVVMPETLPPLLCELAPVASRAEAMLAWMNVLTAVDLAEIQSFVPVAPPRRDFGWARGLAERLMRVQAELADGGLRFADVAAASGMPETDRWSEMTTLEAAFDGVLAAQGLVTRVVAERAGLDSVKVPSWCRRVAVIATPDPLPTAVAYLRGLCQFVPVEVVTMAPVGEDEDGGFDGWGRPDPAWWSTLAFELPDFRSQVRLVANPAAQAEQVAQLAARHPAADEWLAVAIADPEITAPLEASLAEAGLPFFNPEGRSWRTGRLFGLLESLAEWVARPSAAAIGRLLRNADILHWLVENAEDAHPFLPATALRQWDRLWGEHLVTDLAGAQRYAGKWPMLAHALESLATWRQTFLTEAFVESAVEGLAEIFGHRAIDGQSELAESAQRWVDVVTTIDRAARLHPRLERADLWQLAVTGYGEGARFGFKEAGALELGGWLELLWSDAPQLVVAGCNDGLLPDAIVGDAFLPEALREQLGLKTNIQRLARDAYFLAAACAQRGRPGVVEILVGKTSSAGEPLRPSRLLMNCADEALPGRVAHLFKPVEATQANLPWRRAWKLWPRQLPPPSHVSVTALRDWLECPFRFYLRRVLKMETLELGKAELDARDFGTVMHAALQAMGENETLRTTTDESVLREGLLAEFEREIGRRFGRELSLPLVIQFESARQRLRRAATLEIDERLAGWQIVRVEMPFDLAIGPLRVRGKIDRIDRNTDGRIRVIDYKTSDKPVSPLEAHLDTVRAVDEGRPEWLKINVNGRERRWVDLQLPLYRRALAEEFGGALQCAYFNLPKAVSETGLVVWPEDESDLQVAAEICAERIAEAIGRSEFWPPVEGTGRAEEEWATVFHQGIVASVANDWIPGPAEVMR